jgi:hypothetical protein
MLHKIPSKERQLLQNVNFICIKSSDSKGANSGFSLHQHNLPQHSYKLILNVVNAKSTHPNNKIYPSR